MEKNIFIFDQNKCVGCHACVLACINENGFQSPDQWRNIHSSEDLHTPDLPLFYLSIACNHCDDAPCLKNCPALAYSRDDKTGAIIHDPEKCIGCKYCTWACPFDAPKYNPKTRIIEKCTFCNHRIEDNLVPACAHLCPTGALSFESIEFSKEDSKNSSPIKVDVGSRIKIKKTRKTEGPEMDLSLFKDQEPISATSILSSKINALKEWPLVLFTLLSSLTVGLFLSGLTNNFSSSQKHLFILTLVFTAILSMLHLGKKNRAWRSILNFKNSWLSKEIVFFSLFFALVFIDFYIYAIPLVLKSFIGILFLFSIDMLYRLANWKWPLKIHSAQTIFISLTLFAFFTRSYYLLIFIISFRLTIYIYRKLKIEKKNILISTIRVASLISILIIFNFTSLDSLIFILIALGELIDRIEFYNELNVPDPKIEFSKEH
jgi:Fe-S-cluster-containing dehydrogenase component/DMSO reductase anchor subunit